jgi:hypothetical protein
VILWQIIKFSKAFSHFMTLDNIISFCGTRQNSKCVCVKELESVLSDALDLIKFSDDKMFFVEGYGVLCWKMFLNEVTLTGIRKIC